MSLESFIESMPKAELHVRLDGALLRETLLNLAEQNEIFDSQKQLNHWVGLIDKPDFVKLDETARTISSWAMYPEDLALIVYELGVQFSKQNVRYVEVGVDPTTFVDVGMGFEEFMAAINDGRDRAERGWGIKMGWVMTIPREKPRRGDDVARWATGAAARKGRVVALGLAGPEDSQPVGQFKRAFNTVEKKLLPRTAHAGDITVPEGISESLEQLNPNRLMDSWGLIDQPELIQHLDAQGISLCICLSREQKIGHVAAVKEYPLRQLYDHGVRLVLGSGMPSFYKTSLNAEYLRAVNDCGLAVDELIELALNAVRYSFLPDDEKHSMMEEFIEAYTQLKEEHLSTDAAS